jgi:diadenosine tetraphosphate (Ap4A) HIT family hydrolase
MCEDSDTDEKPGGIRILEGRWCNAYLGRWPVRRGYAYVIWKGSHVAEPTELSPEEAAGFWTEVSQVAAALERRYQPLKMNWLSLGNSVPHLHVHLVPRYSDDDNAGGPIEAEAFERAHDAPLDDGTLRTEASALRELLTDRRSAPPLSPGDAVTGDPIERLSLRAEAAIEAVLDALPPLSPLRGEDEASRALYSRIVLQDILRIRLNNHLDAYCLQHLLREGQVETARHILTYLYEEFGHDEILIEDLTPFGITAEQVDNTPPAFSTELLIAYLKYAIDNDGALPDFVWNWFVEWYAARYGQQVVDNASAAFGGRTVRGTAAHLAIDDELDHEHRIEAALRSLLDTDERVRRAELYLDRIVRLLDLYFRELISAEG